MHEILIIKNYPTQYSTQYSLGFSLGNRNFFNINLVATWDLKDSNLKHYKYYYNYHKICTHNSFSFLNRGQVQVWGSPNNTYDTKQSMLFPARPTDTTCISNELILPDITCISYELISHFTDIHIDH